jgi:SAM-dependent methyltransferase
MIKVLQAKLDAGSISNIDPICLFLEGPDDAALKGKRFDLILSHLVLHHVPNLEALMQTMFGCLKPRGRIALTDFERFGPESRKFHPESKMEGVERDGITKIEMECVIKDAGFDKVQVCQAFRLEKNIEPQGTMEFPFLICMGLRKK